MGGEQLASGSQAVDQQAAQEDGSGAVAGDAQGQQRYQGTAHNRVVSSGHNGQALGVALAELDVALVAVLSQGVADAGGHGGAGGRDDTNHGTDHGSTQGLKTDVLHFLHVQEGALLHSVVADHDLSAVLSDQSQNLAEGEHAQNHGQQGQLIVHTRNAEAETGHAGDAVHTDQGAQEAQHGAHQALQSTVLHDADDDDDTHHTGEEQLQGAEGGGHLGQRRSDEQKGNAAHDAADEGADRRGADGLHALAFLGHGITVKDHEQRVRSTGRIYQYRRNITAVAGAYIDGAQADQSGDRGKRKRKGQEDTDTGISRHAGQRAQHHTYRGANDQPEQVLRSKQLRCIR